MTEQVAKEKETEVLAKLDAFAELPDAPPKRKLRLSWVGKLASLVVAFWMVHPAILGRQFDRCQRTPG